MDQVLGLQREGETVTADPWDGPSCETCSGRGEVVLTRGNHWLSVECVNCHGTGHANAPLVPRYRPDGFKVPEDGEEYDPDIHGPAPKPPKWVQRDDK
jgi:hypothetical protein